MQTTQTFAAILPTVMAGFAMVYAGLRKRKLEYRPTERRPRRRR